MVGGPSAYGGFSPLPLKGNYLSLKSQVFEAGNVIVDFSAWQIHQLDQMMSTTRVQAIYKQALARLFLFSSSCLF